MMKVEETDTGIMCSYIYNNKYHTSIFNKSDVITLTDFILRYLDKQDHEKAEIANRKRLEHIKEITMLKAARKKEKLAEKK